MAIIYREGTIPKEEMLKMLESKFMEYKTSNVKVRYQYDVFGKDFETGVVEIGVKNIAVCIPCELIKRITEEVGSIDIETEDATLFNDVNSVGISIEVANQ